MVLEYLKQLTGFIEMEAGLIEPRQCGQQRAVVVFHNRCISLITNIYEVGKGFPIMAEGTFIISVSDLRLFQVLSACWRTQVESSLQPGARYLVEGWRP